MTGRTPTALPDAPGPTVPALPRPVVVRPAGTVVFLDAGRSAMAPGPGPDASAHRDTTPREDTPSDGVPAPRRERAGHPEPAPRRKRTTRRPTGKTLGTLAGVGILAVLIWRLGSGPLLAGLRGIDGVTLLATLGLGLFTTVLSAWRWRLVARGLGIRLPLGPAVADYYRALFLNAALPGGILGDVHRAVRHGRETGDLGRGVRAVVLERTAGQLVLVLAGVGVLLVQPVPALTSAAHRLARAATGSAPTATSFLIALLLIAVAVPAGVLLRRRGTTGGRGAGRPSSPRRRALGAALAEARRGLLARRTWPGVVLCSVAVLAGYLATFLLAARAAGSTAPAGRLLPLMVLALLAMALPLNVAGWGPREGVTAWAFGTAGLGAAQGLTVAVVYGVLAFVAALPGLGVLIAQWIARPARTQVQLEERVLAEGDASHRGSQRVTQHRGAVEAQPGHTVADQEGRHGDVEPVQRSLVEEARHGDTAALDQQPAQTAPLEGPYQTPGGERATVRQDQHLDPVAIRNGHGLPAVAAGAGAGAVAGLASSVAVGAHHPHGRC